jgi:hypothetical protein
MTNSMYSVCATSLSQMLRFDRTTVWQAFTALLMPVTEAAWPLGGVEGDGADFALANDANNAVRAVNELLDDGAQVSITTEDSGGANGLPVGTFLVSDTSAAALANVAQKYNVTFSAHSSTPTAKPLHPATIAVDTNVDLRFVLKSLGFSFGPIDATAGLEGYDVVVSGSTTGATGAIEDYVAAGGGYVGVGAGGVRGPLAGLLPVDVDVTTASDNNALVHATFREDGLVAAGFETDDYAFVYGPLWFTEVGQGVAVDASYGSQPDWYVCGYWRDRDRAMGRPAVVSGSYGAGRVVFVGFSPAFRAYPEGTYRLLANAIWYAME